MKTETCNSILESFEYISSKFHQKRSL